MNTKHLSNDTLEASTGKDEEFNKTGSSPAKRTKFLVQDAVVVLRQRLGNLNSKHLAPVPVHARCRVAS